MVAPLQTLQNATGTGCVHRNLRHREFQNVEGLNVGWWYVVVTRGPE